MIVPAALLDSLPAHTTFQHRSDGFQLDIPASLSGSTVPRAMIRVREIVRPIASVETIVAGVRRELGFSPPESAVAMAVLTREGECAALHPILEGERGCTLGIVFGDDFYRLIIGLGDQVMATAVQHIVERMTVDLPLGLAYRRRRWYPYAPPAGWHGRARHRLVAEWMAPGFPNERALLSVFPARPFRETFDVAMEQHVLEMGWSGYVNETVEAPEVLKIADSLHGARWKMIGAFGGGARTFTELVVLQDATFMYMMRLDHEGKNTEAHVAVLDGVLHSVRSVPVLAHRPSQNSLAFMVD